MPLMPWAASPSAMARTSRGCILVKSATWSKVSAVLSTSHTAVAFGISGALLMANLLCASPTSFGGEAVVISDDGNYALYKPSGANRAMACQSAFTAPGSRPESLFELTVPCPAARGDSVRDRSHAGQKTPENRALLAARLLRRRGAGNRHRGAGAHDLWRPGLCPARDRP